MPYKLANDERHPITGSLPKSGDSSGARFPPPFLYAVFSGAGLILDEFWPRLPIEWSLSSIIGLGDDDSCLPSDDGVCRLHAGARGPYCFAIPCAAVIHLYAIARVECYLEYALGAVYTDYTASIRRYL